MAKIQRLICVIAALICCMLTETSFAESPELSSANRSVVRVAAFNVVDGERKYIGHGTGIVIAPDKIITNAHVVEEGNFSPMMTFQIIPSFGGSTYSATIIKWSPENDLALLQLEPGARLPAATLYTGPLENDADIFAIGYPGSVDVAMELNEDDILRPQSPVRTRGSISAGRSAKAFDTVLHSAPIGPGNSGGPIVDHCGRVVGVNSFGSTNENGGSEFYFAITVRELLVFLKKLNIRFTADNTACRTTAELTQADKEREAQERAKIETEQRIAAELAATKAGKIRREAEWAIIVERENRMLLSGMLMLIATVAGFAGYVSWDRKRSIGMALSIGAAIILTYGAYWIHAGRPEFDDVDAMVRRQIVDDKADAIKNEPKFSPAKTARQITGKPR